MLISNTKVAIKIYIPIQKRNYRGSSFLLLVGYPHTAGFTMPNISHASASVTTMLNSCAPTNDHSTRRFSREMISLRRVSMPMQTNDNEKKKVEKFFASDVSIILPLALSVSMSLLCNMLKIAEASTKPRINFGNLSHTMPNEGRDVVPLPLRVER